MRPTEAFARLHEPHRETIIKTLVSTFEQAGVNGRSTEDLTDYSIRIINQRYLGDLHGIYITDAEFLGGLAAAGFKISNTHRDARVWFAPGLRLRNGIRIR